MFGKLPDFPRWLQELVKVYHLTLILEENRCTHTLACIVIYILLCFLAFVFHWFVHLCHLAHSFIASIWLHLYVCTHTLSLHLYDCTCVSLLIVCSCLIITLVHFHIAYILCVTCLVIFHDDYPFSCMLIDCILWLKCHVMIGIRMHHFHLFTLALFLRWSC